MAKKSTKKSSPKVQTPEQLIAHLEELAEDYELDHTQEFLSFIDHPDLGVRAVAVRCLWEANLTEVWSALKSKAVYDADEEVQATAFSVMGRYMYEEMLHDQQELRGDEVEAPIELLREVHEFLAEALNNTALPLLLRRRALEALSYNPDEAQLELMRTWSKSQDSELRMTAIFAMGRSAREEFLPTILAALEDAHLDVQREAVRAIGESGFESCLPQLEALVNGSNAELRLEAVAAIGEVGGARAVELLQGLTESADPELAELAEVALVNAQEIQMFEQYQDSLDEEDDDDDDGDAGVDDREYLKH